MIKRLFNVMITLNTKRYELKPGTKTVWIEVESQKSIIDWEQYDNIINASPFMRRLGGSETLKKSYCQYGYKVYEIVSKSPCRKLKTVRTFEFY